MNKIQKMLGLSLLCASLTLVGCGGGGGSGGNSNNNDQDAQVIIPEAPEVPEVAVAPVVEEVVQHGVPVEEIAEVPEEESNPVVDVELIQPVDQVAVSVQDLNAPGAIAANPEPTTLALGALGVVFLASRRYRRQA